MLRHLRWTTPLSGVPVFICFCGSGATITRSGTFPQSNPPTLPIKNKPLQLPGGETVAVLGSMRELGAEAPRIHRETGADLKALGLSRLWAYGDFAGDYAEGFGLRSVAFPDFKALRDDVAGLSAIPPGARILVKGSRFWRAERAVDWLIQPSVSSL